MLHKIFDHSYPIYRHPGQDEMQVEVILASKPVNRAPPIYTIRMRYPRIIHAEVETHRVLYNQGTVVEIYEAGLGIMSDENLSRNARSSRAVPVKTILEEVRTKPFVPWHWGKNQKGMQAGEGCNEPVLLQGFPNYYDSDTPVSRERAWLYARDRAVEVAEAMMNAGYHKQIPNRLLEPFMWIDTLVTSTKWSNFLWLRDHKDAEPHLRDLARLVDQALKEAPLQGLKMNSWHTPYVSSSEFADLLIQEGDFRDATTLALKLSAARCARISYKPFDGDASYERELERYDSLVRSDRIHASPLEHQATPDWGWPRETSPETCGNLSPGWIQYRKIIPDEAR